MIHDKKFKSKYLSHYYSHNYNQFITMSNKLNNCLIYETLNGVKEMSVNKNNEGLITLSGVFGVCGVRNNNKRVYETSNYSKMVTEMQERIKNEGGIPGELEHPNMMNITLENVSHKITEINIDENGTVTGTIALLNTPKGQIAQAIVEGGLPLFISSRATGNVDKNTGNVTLERIATYDLVGSPGFSQAKLHLNEGQIVESIDESLFYIENNIENEETIINEQTEETMNMEELLSKFEALEAKVEALEATNESLMEEIETLNEEIASKENLDIEILANGIQKWITEEYSPVLQNWVMEEFGEELRDEIQDTLMEEFEDKMENDNTEDIKEWCATELADGIQNWITEQFATGVQNWIAEEYSPVVENWIKESYEPTLMENMNEKMVNLIEESKENNLNSIEETLKLLEGMEVTKPSYSSATIITEHANEPQFIQAMPASTRVQWDLASEEVKESITRRAKLYNFNVEGAVERFWESINFDEVKPTNHIYEGLQTIEDERERAIRAQLRSWKSRR